MATVIAAATRKTGATRRWNDTPEAFAAVISEWRASAPTEKTVAKSTAAGMMKKICWGMLNTYARAMSRPGMFLLR